MTETKKVETEFGTAEIEVVECDSCGNKVGKEEAKRFAIGERVPNPRINDAEVNGWACEYCLDNGPLSFPQKVRNWTFPTEEKSSSDSDGLTFFIPFAFLMLPIGTIAGFNENENQFVKGYSVASITYIFYLTVIFSLWWFL